MLQVLSESTLFKNVSEKDINEFLDQSGSKVKSYEKGDIIFNLGEEPMYIYILLNGSVSINKYTFSGNAVMLTSIEKKGEMFGEVYAFLNNQDYSFFTMANVKGTEVLLIPKTFFSMEKSSTISNNLLTIFAEKAYFLTEKVKILSIGSLRQKLAMMISNGIDENNTYTFPFNRESLASYLGVARPSLSRELNNMADEGIISLSGKTVTVVNLDLLDDILYD